jgi:hypothetical protein
MMLLSRIIPHRKMVVFCLLLLRRAFCRLLSPPSLHNELKQKYPIVLATIFGRHHLFYNLKRNLFFSEIKLSNINNTAPHSTTAITTKHRDNKRQHGFEVQDESNQGGL